MCNLFALIEQNPMSCARGIPEQREFAVQRAPWLSALLASWGEAEPASFSAVFHSLP